MTQLSFTLPTLGNDNDTEDPLIRTGLSDTKTAYNTDHTTGGHALSWLASGTSAQLIVANSSGVPTYRTVTGDVTINDTGVTAIGAGKVANAMLADGAVGSAELANGAIVPAKFGTIPAVRVYASSAQAINGQESVVVTFDQEAFDTDTMHDTTTQNSRITIKTAGVYIFSVCISWTNFGSDARQVILKKNSSVDIARGIDSAVTISGEAAASQAVTTIAKLAVNDYVEAIVYHESAGNLNLNYGDTKTHLSATWVGLG